MALFLPQLNAWLAAERELQVLERCWQAAQAASSGDSLAPRELQAQLLVKRQLVHDLFKTAMAEAKMRARNLDHRAPMLLAALEAPEAEVAEPACQRLSW